MSAKIENNMSDLIKTNHHEHRTAHKPNLKSLGFLVKVPNAIYQPYIDQYVRAC